MISLRLIWRGVNGPTCPLCSAGLSNHLVLGFSGGELLYLTAVALLWYLVGRSWDRRRGLQPLMGYRSQTWETVFALLTMAWGIVLLALGLAESDRSFSVSFRVEQKIICALLFLWGFLLIAFPVRKLLLAARHREV